MEQFDKLDDQMLGAYVDGQLDPEQRAIVIKAMEDDPEVREAVYQLRRAKDLMGLGFGKSSAPSSRQRIKKPPFWIACLPVMVTSITLLTVSLLAGSVGYYYGRQVGTIIASSASLEQTHRVVLHIRQANMKQFSRAIAYTKNYVEEHDANDQIEIVTHGGAVDLMRVDVSPFEEEIVYLISHYPNVHFVACANGIRDIRKEGIEPIMIEGVKANVPAMDHIIGRVQAGWIYTRADLLAEI